MSHLINKSLNTIIACAFLTNMVAQDISFAAEPCASNLSISALPQDPPRAIAVLAAEYRQSRLIWSIPDSDTPNRYTELLSGNRTRAILLPSGRYLMPKGTNDKDLSLVRAVAHADYEILMQMEREHNKALYHRLFERLFLDYNNEFIEARRLHREIAGPMEDKGMPFVFNHMISTAWELVSLIDKGYLIPEKELLPEERRFADVMRPLLYEKTRDGDYKNFPIEFFDPAERMRAVLRLKKAPAASRISPSALPARQFPSMTISTSLMDIGAEISDDGEITYTDSIEKLIKLIPELARDGFGKVFVYGGLYPISDGSIDLHQVPTSGRHFIHDRNSTVKVEGYSTKRRQVGNIIFKDSHGNTFSINGMLSWNPKLSSGDVNKAMKRLINTIHAHGMKAIADFNPWLAPGAIDESNYKWAFYEELTHTENEEFRAITDEEKRRAWLESITARDGLYSAVRITENGVERVIRVKLLQFFGSHSCDQVFLKPFSPEVKEYYKQALKRIIDTGFDEVRVDQPNLFLRDNPENYPPNFRDAVPTKWYGKEELWRNLIHYAKDYAGKIYKKEFRFFMESYDRVSHNYFFALGADTAYDPEIFNAFWKISRENGTAWELNHPITTALWNRLHSTIYGSNFDQMSLEAVGGAWKAYMMLIITLSHLGVGSMIDFREYLKHTGHIISVVGGVNDDKHSHPTLNTEAEIAARKDFEATKSAVADAPFKKLVGDFYAAVDTIVDTSEKLHWAILNNSDTRRYFSIGWGAERGDWQILLLDTQPQHEKGSVQVELPKEDSENGFTPSRFVAIDGHDKKTPLPMTQWDPEDPKSPKVAVVPFKNGEEYTFFRLVPKESPKPISEEHRMPAERLHESVEELNRTALESSVQDTGKRDTRPLTSSLTSLAQGTRDLKSITKLRFAVPIDIVKNSADVALAFAKIGMSNRPEQIPFEIVVTGIRDEADIRSVEALKSGGAKEALGLTGNFTVSMITEDAIEDVSRRDNRFDYDASTPAGRAKIIKDMTVGTLADGEYACIVTDAAGDPLAQDMIKEFERESGSSGRIAMMVPVKSDEHKIFLLSQIINEWFKALNSGNASAVRKILPPMISPAELIRRLSESMRTVWVALSAA